MSVSRDSGAAPWSIAQRLSALLTVAMAALWLVAVVAAAAVVRHETNEVFDSALQEIAQRLVPLVVAGVGEDDEDVDEDGNPGEHDEDLDEDSELAEVAVLV